MFREASSSDGLGQFRGQQFPEGASMEGFPWIRKQTAHGAGFRLDKQRLLCTQCVCPYQGHGQRDEPEADRRIWWLEEGVGTRETSFTNILI